MNTQRFPNRPLDILTDLGTEGYEIDLNKLCLRIIQMKLSLKTSGGQVRN